VRNKEIYNNFFHLKGKMTSKNISTKIQPSPLYINPMQVLYSDLMFFDKSEVFLITTCLPLNLIIVTNLQQSRRAEIIGHALVDQVNKLKTRNFYSNLIVFDEEPGVVTGSVENNLGNIGVELQTVGAATKVGVIERRIRLIKERCRCMINSLPFKLPKALFCWLLYYVVSRINMNLFSSSNPNASSFEAFTGRKINYKKDLDLKFGEYCVVKNLDQKNATNSMDSRIEGAIVLFPTHNITGTVKFLLIRSLKIVSRSNYKKIPLPSDVINKLNELSNFKGKIYNSEDINEQLDINDDTPIDDEIIDVDFDMNSHSVTNYKNDTIVALPSKSVVPYSPYEKAQNSKVYNLPDQLINSNNNNNIEDGSVDNEHILNEQIQSKLSQVINDDDSLINDTDSNNNDNNLHDNYDNDNDNNDDNEAVMISILRNCCFQINIKQSIKKYGPKAQESIYSELTQLLDKEVFNFIDPKDVSPSIKDEAINCFMFVKEKFLPDGSFSKLKSRLVAGGHQQNRDLYSVDQISSPTVSLQSVMLVTGLALNLSTYNAVIDVVCAYPKANKIGPKVVMKFNAEISNMLIEIKPDLIRFLGKDNQLYVYLDKALYGCLESAKSWNLHISNVIQKIGYLQSNYDKCLYYKHDANGKSFITLYVDDLFVAAATKEERQRIINSLRGEYNEITVNDDLVLNLLGMTLDYSTANQLTISMIGYTKEILKLLPTPGLSNVPADDSIFKCDPNSPLLSSSQQQLFHTIVAKLIYLTKRSRPDILLAVSFLSTRVSAPTIQDENKLKKVLMYLNSTVDLGITIQKNTDELEVKGYIDASFACHDDRRSHTGLITMVNNIIVEVRSTKQKTNTKSTCESELIGLGDSYGYVLYINNILIELGLIPVKPAVIFQDNESTIQIATNGMSSNHRVKHLETIDLFIYDKVEKKKVIIKKLNTKDMLADFFTKALGGQEFRRFRRLIMGN
jgi:hypothetical protein